jgi:hypothetical protein
MTICNPREGKGGRASTKEQNPKEAPVTAPARNLFSTDGPLCLWLVVERERVGFADATSLHSSGAERIIRQKSGTRATLPKVMRSVLAFLLASSASALQLSSPKALLHVEF